MSGSWEIQKSVYSLLDTFLSVPVFSMGDVPQSIEAVYCVVGDTTLAPHDGDNATGFDGTITIHTWDCDPTSNGFKKVKELMNDVYGALNRASLNVSGYTVIDVMFEFEQPFLDGDGISTHGVQRFRILMTKI